MILIFLAILQIMYLNCKTYFSLNYGTFSTEQLVKTASSAGATALALTNINATTDMWDFVKLCREADIKPIPGVEIRNGDQLIYILLAANNKGLFCIHQFLSNHLLKKIDFPAETAFFENGCDGFVIYPLGTKQLQDLLPNEFIGILPWEVNKLFGIDTKRFGDKLVIRQPVTFQNADYFEIHKLLRAIANNILISKLTQVQHGEKHETFKTQNRILTAFRNYPSIVTNTYKLIDACYLQFDFHADKTRQTFTGSKEDDRILLRKLATNGFKSRYEADNVEAKERFEKELKIIDDLGFNAYFLINYDIIRYAQSQGYYYVGRGSGGNSIVAYCLRITNVDPVELNLYFERFLNPERTSPPDFDIDFSYTDRDEVMDYVFKRYGRKYVALLGSFTTFRSDSIIRELGKVYGLPDEEIKTLQQTKRPLDEKQRLILEQGKKIAGFPNNLSVHACGMLISEDPLQNYATLYMPPKGFPTTQMDMFTAEDIGLNKFDILSQRGLGHIRESLQLIKENKGVEVNIHDFKRFRNDDEIKKKIREANTVGCFYIESPAMRQLLKKLRCDDYGTLVAASSIIRPGVAQSGMMREYIYRFHHRDQIKYLHPLFEEHLSETFGVMVFQEDVIKIAHYFAKLNLDEADILRRAMSQKYRTNNQFLLIREKFFANCKKIGHADELTAEVWRQMESFAGYSFNKAHSASFAVESYMSLYLKTYFPKEFMVAVINNFGGYYSRELYFLELLKAGGKIHPPCINESDEYTNIHGDNVHCGLIHIKNLQKKLRELILRDRKQNGPYLNLQDFIERLNPGIEQLNILISIGAFRFTGKSKKHLLWEANFLQKNNKTHMLCGPLLFKEKPVEFTLPEMKDEPLDDLYDEMEILGFTLSNPFSMIDDDPGKYVAGKDLCKHKGRVVTVLVYFINHKQVPTKNDEEMYFGTFIDCELEWIYTVNFPEAAKKYPMHTGGFYRVTGKVVDDTGVFSLEVIRMERVGYKMRRYANL
jgi:DNA-directed DNA polymerase III PolC